MKRCIQDEKNCMKTCMGPKAIGFGDRLSEAEGAMNGMTRRKSTGKVVPRSSSLSQGSNRRDNCLGKIV